MYTVVYSAWTVYVRRYIACSQCCIAPPALAGTPKPHPGVHTPQCPQRPAVLQDRTQSTTAWNTVSAHSFQSKSLTGAFGELGNSVQVRLSRPQWAKSSRSSIARVYKLSTRGVDHYCNVSDGMLIDDLIISKYTMHDLPLATLEWACPGHSPWESWDKTTNDRIRSGHFQTRIVYVATGERIQVYTAIPVLLRALWSCIHPGSP